MKLYLLRHAKSSWASYEDDHERKLSERGLEDAKTLGFHLKQLNLYFDLTICSSAIRTKETLEIIRHNHSTGFKTYSDYTYGQGSKQTGLNATGSDLYASSRSEGGGKPHNHPGSCTSDKHMPPFVVLGYIMKIV